MKQKLFLLAAANAFLLTAHAQHKVAFVLQQRPAWFPQDTVFAAGSFNSWQPGKAGYSFVPQTGGALLVLTLAAGRYEYKFTRGSWQQVECSAAGADVNNRVVDVKGDTTIFISIAAWKDGFGAAPVQSTALPGVKVLSDSFYMPQLGRKRRIRLYLPPGYEDGTRRYPVLYMHDGQNLFDVQTAPYGEWGVDECLDSLIRNGGRPCIVVGIDHGGDKRLSEYNPWPFGSLPEGEGDKYADCLVQTIKPWIDRNYRTLPGRENTFVAGSSMGGLISTYMVLKYPEVFGGAGIFSPAYWTAPRLDGYIDSLPGTIAARLFFYTGAQESSSMVPNMERIADKLALKSNYFLYSIVDEEGRHNEAAWRRWLPAFYRWMFENRAE